MLSECKYTTKCIGHSLGMASFSLTDHLKILLSCKGWALNLLLSCSTVYKNGKTLPMNSWLRKTRVCSGSVFYNAPSTSRGSPPKQRLYRQETLKDFTL